MMMMTTIVLLALLVVLLRFHPQYSNWHCFACYVKHLRFLQQSPRRHRLRCRLHNDAECIHDKIDLDDDDDEEEEEEKKNDVAVDFYAAERDADLHEPDHACDDCFAGADLQAQRDAVCQEPMLCSAADRLLPGIHPPVPPQSFAQNP